MNLLRSLLIATLLVALSLSGRAALGIGLAAAAAPCAAHAASMHACVEHLAMAQAGACADCQDSAALRQQPGRAAAHSPSSTRHAAGTGTGCAGMDHVSCHAVGGLTLATASAPGRFLASISARIVPRPDGRRAPSVPLDAPYRPPRA